MATLLITAPGEEQTPAQVAADNILRAVKAVGQAMIEGHRACFGGLWNHPHATPQEILAALGPRAKEVFDLGGKLVEFIIVNEIASFDSPSEYTPPLSYVKHDDGTVTLSTPS